MTDNEPAFPQNSTILPPGVSKRELFAAMAMHALIDEFAAPELEVGDNRVVADAVKYADALLAELSKP